MALFSNVWEMIHNPHECAWDLESASHPRFLFMVIKGQSDVYEKHSLLSGSTAEAEVDYQVDLKSPFPSCY